MKRNQVNDIFKEDAKRHKTIITYLIFIILVFSASIVFAFLYYQKNKVEYVKYNEKSEVDYNVYLKNNSFYEYNTLKKDNQYISELIDYILANFRYKLSLEKEGVDYMYSYRIEANATVKDTATKKNLYEYNKVLVPSREFSSSENEVSINETLRIDYTEYNNLMTEFIRTYKLDHTESVLKVNLYVEVIGSCEEFERNTMNESITSLEIPLTNKTVAIDITNNLASNSEKIVVCGGNNPTNFIYLVFALLMLIVDVVLIVNLMIYEKNTRSPKTIYEKELKTILSNYRSYIQKVNTKFNLAGYQSLKIDNFTDMLEIRDTTNQPILMVESTEKNSVYFIIPTATKILYMYNIKVSDYEKEPKAKDLAKK